jgi:hypothetical protein
MIIGTVPALVSIVGLLMYAMSDKPKTVEIGRIMFMCGLFVALFYIGARMTRLLPP